MIPIVLPVIATVLLGCAQGVTRISKGEARLERRISSEAYATFARARLLEASGDQQAAVATYRQVLEIDPDADEALVRIGALLCRENAKAAEESFRGAAERNRESTALYEARARCDMSRGNPEAALPHAERALRLSPEDPHLSQLVIRVHWRAGRHADALRYAWSHVAIFPKDTRGWYLLSEVVGPNSPLYPQLLRRATERIPTEFAYSLPQTEEGVQVPVRVNRTAQAELDLDAALTASETHAIHRAARQLGLSTVDLMERAWSAGAFAFARSQAQLAGTLLPEDPRIWQLRLVLADLAGDDAEFERLLAQPPQPPLSGNVDWTELTRLADRRAGALLHVAPTRPRQNP